MATASSRSSLFTVNEISLVPERPIDCRITSTFIFFFARKVLVWGSDKKFIGKFFKFCLEKGEKGGKKLEAKAGKGLYWALFLFVGIPLPGTGAWTGTLAASLLDMDFKKSVIAVMAGVILAGIIMGLGTAGVLGAAGAIFG